VIGFDGLYVVVVVGRGKERGGCSIVFLFGVDVIISGFSEGEGLPRYTMSCSEWDMRTSARMLQVINQSSLSRSPRHYWLVL